MSAGVFSSAEGSSPITLHPLTTEAMCRTVEGAGEGTGAGFSLGSLHFPRGWAGEAADFFPILLHMRSKTAEVRGSFVVVQARQAVGLIGTKHPPKAGRVEIGYGLMPCVQGRGYATAAVRLLLKHLRGWPDVSVVEAGTQPDNFASQRVLEKCGFVLAGTRRGLRLWRLKL